MWYQFVTDVGMVGPDKGEGGKYLLLPPGFDGDIPEGYFVVRSATYSNWVAWRTFLENGDPKPGVDRVKKFTKIYPLSQVANPPELNFVNVSGRDFNTVGPAEYPFWEYLNQVVQEEPTESVDPVTLGFWASIGIQKGKQFAPDERMKKILTEAALVGDATARAIMYRWRTPEGFYYPDTKSAWRLGFVGGYQFEKSGARILDAYAGFFFYATGVTPAMDSKMVGEGSQYMAAFVDSTGQPLDGGKNYRLHLPPNIPVANFWSVILYDNQTRSMLQTDQHWPAVSSQRKGLKVNADSSVDVYFGPEGTGGQGKQLGANHPRQGLEHAPEALWSATALVRQNLAAWRNRVGRIGEQCRQLTRRWWTTGHPL